MAQTASMGATAPATGIAAHIAVIDGQPTTTTRDIADVFGRRHEYVMKIVRQRMEEAGAWGVPQFWETPYTDEQNGQTYSVIRMTEKGFMFVVQKFTGKKAVQTQIAYVDEFERMRSTLNERADHSGDATQKVLPARQPAQSAPASIDVRALLLSGQSEPTAALPPELQQAIDLRAWTLAHEAYGLVREHLARRVAFQAVSGMPRRVDMARATQVISEGDLGAALARTWHNEMRMVVRTAEMTLSASLQALESIRAAAQVGDAQGEISRLKGGAA